MTTKYCKDCKYYNDFFALRAPSCAAYTKRQLDVVTGKFVVQDECSANNARADENKCGYEGKKFLKRKRIWFGLFSN